MEQLISLMSEHAPHAHWWFFGLLMLAGLNFPISEDVILIASGVLAATVVPENAFKLLALVFIGSYLSDWVAYWIGRKFAPLLLEHKWLSRMVNKKRLNQVHSFYKRYGILTLLIGRFIPFGVRNCLFMSAGIGKMKFGKFILADGVACLLSNCTLFFLSYSFSQHYESLLNYIKAANVILFSLFAVTVIFIIWYKYSKKRKEKSKIENSENEIGSRK